MRFSLVLLASTALTACGGGGPISAGGVAVSQGGIGTVPDSGHTFVKPTEAKTYQGIGGAHSYRYSTDDRPGAGNGVQFNQLYAGDASTARNSGISITYDPRDAIFSLSVVTNPGGVNKTVRFQDPVHRTAFGGLDEPQDGVPDLATNGVLYLEAGSASGNAEFDQQSRTFPVGDKTATLDLTTFFYQKPGTVTKYVTYAGFVRNAVSIVEVKPENQPAYLQQNYTLERAAFVYGERTSVSLVPKTGTGSYTGPMIATLIYNPLVDTVREAPTYFQWLSGTSTTKIDFAANTFTVDLAGRVGAPLFDVFTRRNFALQDGATFAASGTGRIDLINAGGFLGAINSAAFTQPGGTVLNLNIAGSSVDGAFFGPAAQEVGGGFRIVGGVPDERIDILGTFTGVK